MQKTPVLYWSSANFTLQLQTAWYPSQCTTWLPAAMLIAAHVHCTDVASSLLLEDDPCLGLHMSWQDCNTQCWSGQLCLLARSSCLGLQPRGRMHAHRRNVVHTAVSAFATPVMHVGDGTEITPLEAERR